MKGKNELHLCELEMVTAVQEYLKRRWSHDTPKVVGVTFASSTYRVLFDGIVDTEPVKYVGTAYNEKHAPWKGCAVCGASGVRGYVCARSDCPTKVTAA